MSPLPETGDRKRAGSEPIKPVIPRTFPTTSARSRAVARPAPTAHRCAADAAAAGQASRYVAISPSRVLDTRDPGFTIMRDSDTLYVTEAPFTQWDKTISALTGSLATVDTLTALGSGG